MVSGTNWLKIDGFLGTHANKATDLSYWGMISITLLENITNIYRYEMNNCLIDDAIGYIIWHCDCVPSFFDGNITHDLALPWKKREKLLCFREKLDCAIDKMMISFSTLNL